MTDELSIQNQRPSALPYVLGGAVVGTGAGLGVNQWTNFTKGTPMTHEDVIAEVNAKDKFEARIAEGAPEASTWKEVQAKVEAVKTAENKLAEAQKVKLPDTAKEATDLANAKNARQAEFDRLLEIEKNKAGAPTVTELPTAEQMRLGIKGEDASKVARDFNHYNTTLRPEYETARHAVETNATVAGHAQYQAAKTSRNSFKTSVETYYSDVANNAALKDPKARTAGIRSLDRRLENIAKAEFKYPTRAEIMKQAFKDGQMIPVKGRWASLVPDYIDAKGNKFVLKDDVKYSDLKKAAKDAVDTQRKALIDEIKATESEFISAKQNLEAFGKRTEFRSTGKKGGKNLSYVCDLADVQGKDAVKTYTEQQKVMSKFLEGQKLTAREKTILSQIQTTFSLNPHDVSESKKIATQLEQRIALAQEYATLDAAKTAAIGGQSRIALYEAQMEEAIQSNKAVQDAAKKIKKMATRYRINVEATANVDEAALKQIVEDKLKGTKFETDIAKFQQLYDEATKKAGVVDEAAVNTAKGELESAKGELEKAAKSLGEKMSKGGKAKWIAPVVGGVALALAGLALRPNSKEA